jgi:hypothetical protein
MQCRSAKGHDEVAAGREHSDGVDDFSGAKWKIYIFVNIEVSHLLLRLEL